MVFNIQVLVFYNSVYGFEYPQTVAYRINANLSQITMV